METDLSVLTDEKKQALLDHERGLIIDAVNELRCTYPSEISRSTLIPKERCISLIYQMLKENKLYRLKLHSMYVPLEMLGRLGFFWSIGIRGFEKFQKITWLIPEPQIPISKYPHNQITDTRDVVKLGGLTLLAEEKV